MDTLERVQERPTKTNKVLDHLCYEERLREVGGIVQAEEEEDHFNLYKCSNDGTKETLPGSLQWCPVTREERENTFLLWDG